MIRIYQLFSCHKYTNSKEYNKRNTNGCRRQWQQHQRILTNYVNQCLKKLDDAIDFATENLDKFIQPISDFRGSSHYRLEAMKRTI